MRKKYASDISREKFEEIKPLLQSVRKRTKPTTVDLYEVFCAVLYLPRSGCQWRLLPSDFPKWGTVHSYFAKWSKPDQDAVSVLERALKKSEWRAEHALKGEFADFTFNCSTYRAVGDERKGGLDVVVEPAIAIQTGWNPAADFVISGLRSLPQNEIRQ